MPKRKPKKFINTKSIASFLKWYRKCPNQTKALLAASLVLAIALPLQVALTPASAPILDLAPLEPVGSDAPSPQDDCVVTGCSFELCLDQLDSETFTTCVYKPEFACLTHAVCERQPSGRCGFTQTPAYTNCLNQLE